MKLREWNAHLHGLVVFRALLNDPVVARLLDLTDRMEAGCSSYGPVCDAVAAFEAALFEYTTNWGSYLSNAVLEAETICVRQAAAGQLDALLQSALDSELQFLQQLCGLTLDELFEQLRGQGITDLSDVKYAVLETNGRLSVLPRSPLQPVTPEQLGLDVQDNVFLPIILINDGRVLTDNLRQAGRDDRWLAQELHRQGIARSQDVFLLSVDQHGTVVCLRKEAAR